MSFLDRGDRSFVTVLYLVRFWLTGPKAYFAAASKTKSPLLHAGWLAPLGTDNGVQ